MLPLFRHYADAMMIAARRCRHCCRRYAAMPLLAIAACRALFIITGFAAASLIDAAITDTLLLLLILPPPPFLIAEGH